MAASGRGPEPNFETRLTPGFSLGEAVKHVVLTRPH
jgi:hypothetical protein